MRPFERIRQKKLVQWLIAYLAVAWVVVEAVDLVSGQFGWPPAVGRATTLLLAVGVIAVAVAAWYHGERGRQKVTGIELAMFAGIMVLAGAALRIGVREPDATPAPDPAPNVVDEPAPERSSIAVLPFVDLSPEGDQRYFGDGVAEEILNRLAAVPGLRVAARTSSFAFREGEVTVDSIGRALRVAYVLEGSVRKQGPRVRVTAQLVDASEAFHVWSRTFDRDLTDIFRIQDEIARAIADTLRLELTTMPSTAAGPVPDLSAHDLYLRALDLWHARGAALDTAESLLRRAVEIDPRYADAWALLAHTYAVIPFWTGRSWPEVREDGYGAARRAITLNPGLPAAYSAIGELHKTDGRFAAAETALRRALALNPGLAEAVQDMGQVYLYTGRTDAAGRYLARAYEIDPLSLPAAEQYAEHLQSTGRHDRALRIFTDLARRAPWRPRAPLGKAWSEAHLGHPDRAEQTLADAEGLAPGLPSGTSRLFRMALAVETDQDAQAFQAEVARVLGTGRETSAAAAFLFAIAGHADGAISVIERFIHDPTFASEFVRPAYDFVRDDPRVEALAVVGGLRVEG